MLLADVDLEALKVRYERARPALKSLVDFVVERLQRQVAQRGLVPASIEGRVKGTSSFLKKAIRKDYASPWAEIRDKAAARVTSTSREEVSTVEEPVREEFAVLHYEDKRSELEPNQLGYLGVHFEVVVPFDCELEDADRLCEIQVRTGAVGFPRVIGNVGGTHRASDIADHPGPDPP